MYYENGCAKDVQVAYIGGGSRGWAWTFMTDLAGEPSMCGTLRLYDIDRESAEANKIIGEKIANDPRAVSRWRFTVENSLKTALTGADFVIISILPGTFDEMEYDVHLPERLGIYQSVGDTAGPGGFMRALRTLPMIAEIGQAIKQHAPDAWVLNFTNPMTTCIRTLYTVFPDIKAMGCCHEVFGTQKLLCAMLEDMAGISGVTRQEIKTGVTGINHFTWLYSASYQGMDLMSMYRAFVEKYKDEGFARGADANWMNNSFNCNHRVKFDLFRRYGLIAAAGDRHLAEFLPPWYLRDPQTVRSWGFGLTTVASRKKGRADRIARQKRLVSGGETINLTSSGEEGCLLMKALLGLGDMVSNVNLPNRGQIPGLPMGAVVETNALFRRDEISPVLTPPLPKGLDALIGHQVAIQEATVTAALTCDYGLALNTFLADPQMSQVRLEDGKQLFLDMLAGTAAYLPEQWKKICAVRRSPMQESFKLVSRPHQGPGCSLELLNKQTAEAVRAFHRSFPMYQPTPLVSLGDTAKELGLGAVYLKDESWRFGLNAFKVLGGSFAIGSLLAGKLGISPEEASYGLLVSPKTREALGEITFVTATDGNHGRGVAWSATQFGQKSVVYMPKGSAQERLENIRAAGAEASITDMNYDGAVRHANAQAKTNGWVMVQDTAWEDYEEIPTRIMQGYLTMGLEAFEQLPQKPTHIFLQAGVGSMAGAMAGLFAAIYGSERPTVVIVEPNKADCLFRTAQADDGTLHFVTGDMDTIMAGLACGEPCTIAWEILRDYADYFISCPDYTAAQGMRLLNNPPGADTPVISGESGAATFGAVAELMTDPALEELRRAIGLDEQSRVLCFSTEGATDRKNYDAIVNHGKYPKV